MEECEREKVKQENERGRRSKWRSSKGGNGRVLKVGLDAGCK